jgi:hypothetical protein
VEAENGAQYNRNSSHVRKYVTREHNELPDGPVENIENTEVLVNSEPIVEIKAPTPARPQRERKLPTHLADFVLK